MVYIILWANCVARSYKYVDDDDGKQAMVDFQQSGYTDFYWSYRQILKIQSHVVLIAPLTMLEGTGKLSSIAWVHCYEFLKGILNNSIYGNFFIEIISHYVNIYSEQL